MNVRSLVPHRSLFAFIALALAAGCDQPPDEAQDGTSQISQEAVTLPACSSVCSYTGSCSDGCSSQNTAMTCGVFLVGNCGGASEPSGLPPDSGLPGAPYNAGGAALCPPYQGCHDSGNSKMIGQTVIRVNKATKAHPTPVWTYTYINTYAQPQVSSRTTGLPTCIPQRCTCDRIYRQNASIGGTSSWGNQGDNVCRKY
jgi:hypothetical protein